MSVRDILNTNLGALVRGHKHAPGRSGHSHAWPGPMYLRLQRWRRDLLMVTEQIAAIVQSNAPLVRGLDAAALDAPNGNVEAMLLTVRDDLAAGESLADAMAIRPRFFPPFYVDLVRAGERTGRLSESLRDASDTVRRMVEHRTHKLQFMYPALLLTIHIALGAFMIVKVYPVFAEIAEEMNGTSYIPMWIRLGVDYISERYPFIAAVAGLAGLALMVMPRVLRDRTGGVGLYVPFWRRVVRKRYLALIVHVLRTMLRADVPLDRAVAECAVLAVPRSYRRALGEVTDRIEAGETLADALDHYPRLFHRPFRDVVRLGEHAGRLPEVLERIGSLYDAQTAKVERIVVDYTLAACVVAISVITLAGTLLVFQLNVTLVQAIMEQL